MRKLLVLTVLAVTLAGTSTAFAENEKAAKNTAVRFQQKRLYHAEGVYKSIWNVAFRTVYHPNLKLRALWVARAKKAKRVLDDARTEIQRLTQPVRPPHYRELLCIHRYEGSWTDSGGPYYGGLQMDLGFQAAYGAHLLRTKGTADHWTPLEQMWVAEEAIKSRGFHPWPNTAHYCGLL